MSSERTQIEHSTEEGFLRDLGGRLTEAWPWIKFLCNFMLYPQHIHSAMIFLKWHLTLLHYIKLMFQEDVTFVSYSFVKPLPIIYSNFPCVQPTINIIVPLSFLLWALVSLCLTHFSVLLFLSWWLVEVAPIHFEVPWHVALEGWPQLSRLPKEPKWEKQAEPKAPEKDPSQEWRNWPNAITWQLEQQESSIITVVAIRMAIINKG